MLKWPLSSDRLVTLNLVVVEVTVTEVARGFGGQGLSSRWTGQVGPSSTTPRIPEEPAAEALGLTPGLVEEAHPVAAIPATTTSMRIRFTAVRPPVAFGGSHPV